MRLGCNEILFTKTGGGPDLAWDVVCRLLPQLTGNLGREASGVFSGYSQATWPPIKLVRWGESSPKHRRGLRCEVRWPKKIKPTKPVILHRERVGSPKRRPVSRREQPREKDLPMAMAMWTSTGS